MKVALIGSGYFSQFHVAAWQRLADVELLGLFTLDPVTGRDIAQRFSIDTLYESLDQLIQAQPDLVDVIAPPEAHLSLITELSNAGLDCVCQKPFCSDLQAAVAAVELSTKNGTQVIVHENFRHQPWYRRIKQSLDENILGEIYQISFRIRPGDGQGEDAYLARQPYFREQPQFLIRETAVHWVDVFRYLIGDVTDVFAELTTLNPVIKGEDAGLVLFRFGNGVRGLLDGNRLSDHASDNTRLTMGEMCIEGAKGELTLNGSGEIYFRAHGAITPTAIPFEWNDIDFGGDCVYLTQKHIVEHLLRGAPLENNAQDYLENRRLETRIYESAKTGSWC